MMRGGTLCILSHRVQGQRRTLPVKPCGHGSGYSFCPLTFKLHMLVVDDKSRERETLLISGHGVKCRGQLLPLAHGYHALRFLVIQGIVYILRLMTRNFLTTAIWCTTPLVAKIS